MEVDYGSGLGPDRIILRDGELFAQRFKTHTYPQCKRQFRHYDAILRGTKIHRAIEMSSSFEELSKTLELVSDPIARLVLSKRIAADLAGTGIEVNFGGSSC